MVARLRNACLNKLTRVYVIQTNSTLAISRILKENNYIESFSSGIIYNKRCYICLFLRVQSRYNTFSSITSLKRISRPGLRIYSNSDNLPKVLGGLGLSVFFYDFCKFSSSLVFFLKISFNFLFCYLYGFYVYTYIINSCN